MPTHNENIEILRDTLSLYQNSEELKVAIQNSVNSQKLINEEDLINQSNVHYDTEANITITKQRTFEACKGYNGKIAALNFASAVHPGGGVRWGSNAQEESMCRISTLLPCLEVDELMDNFYDKHKNTDNRRNNDDCIYTPSVYVIKEDTLYPKSLNQTDYYQVNVITCAAPDLRECCVSNYELRMLHVKRMKRIFEVALSEGNEAIVIGAFGCGAFNNDATIVADAVSEVCEEYKYKFKDIICAIYCTRDDDYNYSAFKRAFMK